MFNGLTKKQINDLNVDGFTIIEKILDENSLYQISVYHPYPKNTNHSVQVLKFQIVYWVLRKYFHGFLL